MNKSKAQQAYERHVGNSMRPKLFKPWDKLPDSVRAKFDNTAAKKAKAKAKAKAAKPALPGKATEPAAKPKAAKKPAAKKKAAKKKAVKKPAAKTEE